MVGKKKISDYLKSQQIKMSPQIVLNYLDYLKQAMLIYNVKRTEINGKKIFEINEKFYFEDWGLMNSLIGFSNFRHHTPIILGSPVCNSRPCHR